MPAFQAQIQKIALARKNFQKAENDLYLARLQAQKTLNPNRLADIQQTVEAAASAFETARKALQDGIGELYAQHGSAQALVANLDAKWPILLLPLRIETRFMGQPRDHHQLWVRIFPDDIHVNTHEPLLTDEEVMLGETYWKALAAANRLTVGDKEDRKKAAWSELSKKANGKQRALWVARNTRPINWTPSFKSADNTLQFPPPSDTKTHSWTRQPQTQLLPDKFVVTLVNGAGRYNFEGKLIPDKVALGPDPFLAEQAVQRIGEEIVPQEDLAWMTDFDKAVENGLALRIDLLPEHFNAGRIERVVVAGLLCSADQDISSQLVSQMVENHHYSPSGFSLLPQGTPTNNTEKDAAGYIRNEDFLPKGYYEGVLPTLFRDDPSCDGKRLADLLGIEGANLEEVPYANLREQEEAEAMNSALYPATLGYFFGVAMSPVISEAGANGLRNFFNRFVSARGPLPSIRIGNQPYGLLLTSDQRRWANDNSAEADFYTPLGSVLLALQAKFNALAAIKAVHVGMEGDPSDILLKVMGLQPGSVEFHQHLASTADMTYSTLNNADRVAFQDLLLARQQTVQDFLQNLGYTSTNPAFSFPAASGLYWHPLNQIFTSLPTKNLVDGLPVADNRFLPETNYLSWLTAVKSLDDLQNPHPNGPEKPAPRYLLFLLLRHALSLELLGKTLHYYRERGMPAYHGAFSKGLINFLPNNPDLSAWELLRGVPKTLNKPGFDIETSLGEHFLLAPAAHPDAKGLAQVRTAMLALASLSTARLERLLTEHLDLCSYRLDAWVTGLFTRQLAQNRMTQPKGLYLGAFGWVMDLAPDPRTPLAVLDVPEKLRPATGAPVFKLRQNAGFVHTPSLNHATAAGLLLAGHHNHGTNYPPAIGDAKPFAVNLSSERVRRATFIFEGVQNGQPLDALLGQQFERALHDATVSDPTGNLNLNQYIYKLREKYPVLRDTMPQRGAVEVQESVAAYPVVNGLKLLESTEDFSDFTTDSIHLTRLKVEKDQLANTLDAAKDLIMAETAYQATQGNLDRTAAVLNAFQKADLPPSLEVLKTPRSSSLTFVNRATVHFRTDMSAQAGQNWTTKKSPRAVMETGLNRWLGQCIGHPTTVVCHVAQLDEHQQEVKPATITLNDLEIQPIDFVYIIGTADLHAGMGELEGRVAQVYRKKKNVPPESNLKIYFDDAIIDLNLRSFAQMLPLARALNVLVTTARAASAQDFAGRSKAQTTGDPSLRHGWDLSELKARAQQALDDLNAKIFYLKSKMPNEAPPPEISADMPATFEELFARYAADGNNPTLLQLPLSDNGFEKLTTFLREASLFGLPLAYPDEAALRSTPDLLARAASIWKSMQEKSALAAQKMAEADAETQILPRVNRLKEAVKAVLGQDFLVLPRFRYSNPDDMTKTLGDQTQLLRHIVQQTQSNADLALESWMQSATHVRPELSKLEKVRLLTEALGGKPIHLRAAQTPFRIKDSWLSVEFPAIYEPTGKPFQVMDDTIALAICGEAPEPSDLLQSALVADEWTETIPTDKEITGLAYHYNQPNAAPPQTILLAVEPTRSENWNWDTLMGVLDDTLQRAQTRAVEPAHLLEDPLLGTLLPMTLAEFDLQNVNPSLDYLIPNDEFMATKADNYPLYAPFK